MPGDTRDGRAPRVTVLYLLYPTGPGYRRDRPMRALRRILSRFPGESTVVSIDNSAAGTGPEELGRDEYAIGGDNTYREFTGWQRGLEFVREQRIPTDVFLLANDTLLSHSRNHRWLVNRDAVECSQRVGAMVGRRMRLPVEGHILGNPVIPYVRTHLFVLPAAALDELGTVVSLDRPLVDRLLLREFDPATRLFQPDAPISEAVRDYILFHLHSAWYRRKPYAAEHFEMLRGKAISILNSLLLSRRVYDLGYPLVSLAGASRAVREDAGPARLRAEWVGNEEGPAVGAGSSGSRFWGTGADAYRGVPARRRGFTLENVLDFLERREHPEHL